MIWNRGGSSILPPDRDDIVDYDPGVITTGKYTIYVLGTDVSNVIERGP